MSNYKITVVHTVSGETPAHAMTENGLGHVQLKDVLKIETLPEPAPIKYGYHTPELTEAFIQMLATAGIPWKDESWKNDEIDRVVIPQTKYCVWVGDPKNKDYSENVLEAEGDDDKEDDRILVSNSFDAILEKLLELLSKDLNGYTSDQLGTIYEVNIGYNPSTEPNPTITTEEVCTILNEHQRTQHVLIIPENL